MRAAIAVAAVLLCNAAGADGNAPSPRPSVLIALVVEEADPLGREDAALVLLSDGRLLQRAARDRWTEARLTVGELSDLRLKISIDKLAALDVSHVAAQDGGCDDPAYLLVVNDGRSAPRVMALIPRAAALLKCDNEFPRPRKRVPLVEHAVFVLRHYRAAHAHRFSGRRFAYREARDVWVWPLGIASPRRGEPEAACVAWDYLGALLVAYRPGIEFTFPSEGSESPSIACRDVVIYE